MTQFGSNKGAMQISASVRFPARITADKGVAVNKQSGVWNIELAYNQLTRIPTVNDQSKYSLAVYNELTRQYENIRLIDLPARVANLNRYNLHDADETLVVGANYFALVDTLTSRRVITLPLANTFADASTIYFQDEVGGISEDFPLVLRCQGNDRIDGQTEVVMSYPYSALRINPNGNDKFSYDRIQSMKLSQTTVADLPPANPREGDFWWNSADGILYIYYIDFDSGQWVATNAPKLAPTPTGTVGTAPAVTEKPRAVKNEASRLAMNDPNDIEVGGLVIQIDTGDLWLWTNDAVGNGKHWERYIPHHNADNVRKRIVYDPVLPYDLRMSWHDDRMTMGTVDTIADLSNRTLLPISHIIPGKLVYVRATGTIYELVSSAATMTNTLADWSPMAGGVSYIARVGQLPDPATVNISDGQLFVVKYDFAGVDIDRLVAWDANALLPGAAVGQTGAWKWLSPEVYRKALRATADQATDLQPGDIQFTFEAGHKEIKAVDNGGVLQPIFSWDEVAAAIAAGNNFRGTVEENGHGVAGATDLGHLTAENALSVNQTGYYFTFVGTAGHVVGPTEVGGAASAIAGARLNPGDWLQVANTGTLAAPVMQWTHIPGDLLAKSRGDALYGFNTWSAGAYESGSIVVYNGDVYKAAQPVLLADLAPGDAGTVPGYVNPWSKLNIAGGLKVAANDGALPTTAPAGVVYIVLSSTIAGNKQALFAYDGATNSWQQLGGGGGAAGIPIDISQGVELHGTGVPIGTIIMWPGTSMPPGYLFCDGGSFSQQDYPELFSVLNQAKTPDLRNHFIMGAGDISSVAPWTKNPFLTARPKTAFTTNDPGGHSHAYTDPLIGSHGIKGADHYANEAYMYPTVKGAITASSGAHTHTITGGGDATTRPDNVILAFIIKASDRTVTAR